MDWSNERYVRIYTRDTISTRKLPWEARCVWWDFLRRIDRAGVVDLDGATPVVAVAILCDVPDDVASSVVQQWLSDGRLEHCTDDGGQLVVPHFIEAQEAVQSDAARAKAYRERRRDTSRDVTQPSRKVTRVTRRHARVTPSVPPVPDQPAVPVSVAKSSSLSSGTRLPRDWSPESEVYDWARDNEAVRLARLEVDRCLDEFRDYWCAVAGVKGRKSDWVATFRNALRKWRARNPGLSKATRPFVPPTPASAPVPSSAPPAESELASPAVRDAVMADIGSLFAPKKAAP